jgi:hypothetical protein
VRVCARACACIVLELVSRVDKVWSIRDYGKCTEGRMGLKVQTRTDKAETATRVLSRSGREKNRG